MAFKNMFAHICQAVEVHHCCNHKHTGTSADIQVWATYRFSKRPLHAQVVKEYDISLRYCHINSLDSHSGILILLEPLDKGITFQVTLIFKWYFTFLSLLMLLLYQKHVMTAALQIQHYVGYC